MGAMGSRWREEVAQEGICNKRKRDGSGSDAGSEGARTDFTGDVGEGGDGKRQRVENCADEEEPAVAVEEVALDANGSATTLPQPIQSTPLEKLCLLDKNIMKLSWRLSRLQRKALKYKWEINYEDVQKHARYTKWPRKYYYGFLRIERFNEYKKDSQAAQDDMKLLEDQRREICKEMEARAPLGDVNELKKMKMIALKKLAVQRGVKGGRSWQNACPPRGKKEDIINALIRDPRDPRPKTRGQGWLPPHIEQNEKNHRQWLHERYLWYKNGNSEEFSKDHPSIIRAPGDTCRYIDADSAATYENEKALKCDDDWLYDYCTICREDGMRGKWRWHCAGCNICRAYPISSYMAYQSKRLHGACEKCTPALHYFDYEMGDDTWP